MSEVKSRQFHSSEFKAKIGLEALRGGNTINEIGQEYGVHPVTVIIEEGDPGAGENAV
jgi:transposase-like protein